MSACFYQCDSVAAKDESQFDFVPHLALVHPFALLMINSYSVHHCNNRCLDSWQFCSTQTLSASMTGASCTCQKTANILNSLGQDTKAFDLSSDVALSTNHPAQVDTSSCSIN